MLKFKSILLVFDQELYEVKWRQGQIQRYRVEASKEVIINADRALFAQMMIIAVPFSPLSPYSADGSLRKPNKASLAK